MRPAPRRGAHRRKRSRRALPGVMVHQDGSRHAWVPGREWDLIVTMDDATSEIYSAFFVAEEGTMSSFRAVSEVIRARGLFCSLYADRASHYWHTPEVGGKVDKDNPTQVGRALQTLGIELIAAYSPEARGRSERMFGHLAEALAAGAPARRVFLNAPARAILERQPRSGSAFVFPSPFDPARPLSSHLPLWYLVRREAEIEDVRIHDLSHTYASHAVLQGVPLPVVSRLLGHKNPGMTLHVGDRETEAAAERIGMAIARALDGSEAGTIG